MNILNNRLIFVALLLVLSVVYFVSRPDYGILYNSERKLKGIPIIPEWWETDREFKFTSQNWYPQDVDISKPHHSLKAIRCKIGIIEHEYDYYHLEYNKLGISFSYLYDEKMPWKVTLDIKNGNEIIESKELTYSEGVSLLNKYGLEI